MEKKKIIENKEHLKKRKEKALGFINEFKKFIQRGNVLDLAVGVIIGGAFGKIVTSLVNDILMPIIGLIIGGQDFKNLSIKIKDTTIAYGAFIQNIVDFLLVAFFIFLFVKVMNNFFKKKEEKKEEPPKPAKSEETILLEEIRDLLKSQLNKQSKKN